MNSKQLEELLDTYPDVRVMDGYDDCIIGVCERFGMETVLAYDKDKVIAKLMTDGMTEEEAHEFFNFNQIGAWVGDYTPVFVTVTPYEMTEEEKESFRQWVRTSR